MLYLYTGLHFCLHAQKTTGCAWQQNEISEERKILNKPNQNKTVVLLLFCSTTLTVSRLHSGDDCMIDEYGAVGGIKIGR
jgi:hypothetical protein